MSTKELKYLLISKIDDTEDEQSQAESIYKGRKDIELGNYILNEDLHNDVMKWLNK